MGKDTVSVREVYTLVDKAKTEIMDAVKSVDGKVESLQAAAGDRISKVESKVANIEGRMMTFIILIPSAISLFGIIVSLIVGGKK